MNLWLRLLWLLLTARRRGPVSLPRESSTLNFRVWPHDLDLSFHLNNGRYLTLMDLGRLDTMVRSGLWREVMRHKWTPIASAITDANGHFSIANAPDGANIPLVIQVGRWRRSITIPNVGQCQDNALPDKTLSLPKNHNEGDIPNIAVSIGAADSVECLLRRFGIDAAEFTPGAAGPGRVHIFHGGQGGPNTNPAAPESYQSLWDSSADISKFDMVLLSCEGVETASTNQQVLFNYVAAGGRVYASHFHYSWFNSGPFGAKNLATWTAGSNLIGTVNTNPVTTLPSSQLFPKGQAFQQWLGGVKALTSGKLPINAARHNADVSAANTASQAWLLVDTTNIQAEAFTFNAPFNIPNQCGRVVFSDVHVGAADYGGSMIVPTGCSSNPLSPQELALEFMLFDLAACVTPNDQAPKAP